MLYDIMFIIYSTENQQIINIDKIVLLRIWPFLVDEIIIAPSIWS